MLRCQECGCRSESGRGWFGYITEDPEDGQGAQVALYCPPCAQRELEARPRLRHYV